MFEFENALSVMLTAMQNHNRCVISGDISQSHEIFAQVAAIKTLMETNSHKIETETVPYFENEDGEATGFLFPKLTISADYVDKYPGIKTLGFKTDRNMVSYKFKLPTDKLCPFGGDIADDCADCAYAGDYHYDCGECVRR